MLTAAYDQLARSFDEVNGGFGGAPKFPRPVTLNFLFRFAHHAGLDERPRPARARA